MRFAVLLLLFIGACGMSEGAAESDTVDLLAAIDLERDVIDKNELAVEHNVPVFPSGRPVTLRIEVRKDGVKATAGDWVVVDYRGSLERLGNFEGFEFWTDQSLVVGIWRTAIRISKFEMRPL